MALSMLNIEQQRAIREKMKELEMRVLTLREINEALLMKADAEMAIARGTIRINEDRIAQDERQIEIYKQTLPESASSLHIA